MDQILNERFKQSVIKPIEKKEIQKNNIVEKTTECSISIYNKKLTIRAKLCADGYAEFLDDSFLKYLTNKCAAHVKLSESDSYKYPYTELGFKFKPLKNTNIYKNKRGDICDAESILYKTCQIVLTIVPYSLVNNDGNTITGMSIRASSVQAI